MMSERWHSCDSCVLEESFTQNFGDSRHPHQYLSWEYLRYKTTHLIIKVWIITYYISTTTLVVCHTSIQAMKDDDNCRTPSTQTAECWNSGRCNQTVKGLPKPSHWREQVILLYGHMLLVMSCAMTSLQKTIFHKHEPWWLSRLGFLSKCQWISRFFKQHKKLLYASSMLFVQLFHLTEEPCMEKLCQQGENGYARLAHGAPLFRSKTSAERDIEDVMGPSALLEAVGWHACILPWHALRHVIDQKFLESWQAGVITGATEVDHLYNCTVSEGRLETSQDDAAPDKPLAESRGSPIPRLQLSSSIEMQGARATQAMDSISTRPMQLMQQLADCMDYSDSVFSSASGRSEEYESYQYTSPQSAYLDRPHFREEKQLTLDRQESSAQQDLIPASWNSSAYESHSQRSCSTTPRYCPPLGFSKTQALSSHDSPEDPAWLEFKQSILGPDWVPIATKTPVTSTIGEMDASLRQCPAVDSQIHSSYIMDQHAKSASTTWSADQQHSAASKQNGSPVDCDDNFFMPMHSALYKHSKVQSLQSLAQFFL